MTQEKTKLIKGLIYGAIALLIVNTLLIFIPFAEIYQPSYSETTLGVTTYKGWYIQFASPVKFLFPVLFIFPYLSAVGAFMQKKDKSPFIKIMTNKVTKPIYFRGLILAALANLISIFALFNALADKANAYEKYGAYCHFTTGGVLYVVLAIALILVLCALSSLASKMIGTDDTTAKEIEKEAENEEETV